MRNSVRKVVIAGLLLVIVIAIVAMVFAIGEAFGWNMYVRTSVSVAILAFIATKTWLAVRANKAAVKQVKSFREHLDQLLAESQESR